SLSSHIFSLFLHDALPISIQILIYWFVFGTLRERAPVEVNGMGIPFFIWLLAGFFLWIFSFQSMIEGSKSIYSRLRILSKMSFPDRKSTRLNSSHVSISYA